MIVFFKIGNQNNMLSQPIEQSTGMYFNVYL